MTLWQMLSSFPSVIPSYLLAILLIYWLFSMLGLVDMGDNLEVDAGADMADGLDAGHTTHVDGEHADLHSLAGYLVALGLGGVPFSIVVSLLVFFTWLATTLLHRYFLLAFGFDLIGDMLRLGMGCLVLFFSAVCSIRLAAYTIKPMRPLFVKHHARSKQSLVGLICHITTQNVNEKFGRAQVADTGVNLNIRVWASSPNTLRKDSAALILSYNEENQQYEVVATEGNG